MVTIATPLATSDAPYPKARLNGYHIGPGGDVREGTERAQQSLMIEDFGHPSPAFPIEQVTPTDDRYNIRGEIKASVRYLDHFSVSAGPLTVIF